MLVRPMSPDDVKEVAKIEKEGFSQPWSEKGFLDALKLEDNIILVAEEKGEILGYECTYVSFDEGEITNIAVRSTEKRKGTGSNLIKQLQQCAIEKGVKTIVLEVRVSNTPAIRLYEKMGFKNIGTRKNLYECPIEDGFIMTYTAEEKRC